MEGGLKGNWYLYVQQVIYSLRGLDRNQNMNTDYLLYPTVTFTQTD